MTAANPVARHYGSVGLAERVLAAFHQRHGDNTPVTVEGLAPLDHFHGRGVQATRELAELLKPQPGEQLLDIGSGIGGPARWLAFTFACHVTGVDLTPEFCEAARSLNAAAGVSRQVTIIEGSALALPVPDGGFDAAYSQNVIMNIAKKRQFYREARRALRPGGRFALSNVCKGPAGDPYFPVPWATTGETSFLATADETRADLIAAGFEVVDFRDTTAAVLALQRQMRERLERGETPPPVAADIILGERAREMQRNSARSTEDGRSVIIEVLVRKPG